MIVDGAEISNTGAIHVRLIGWWHIDGHVLPLISSLNCGLIGHLGGGLVGGNIALQITGNMIKTAGHFQNLTAVQILAAI